MSGVYNNWIKVNNPNLPNDIPPMESGGFQPPFYFGGSQVPVNLGLTNTDLNITGGGIHGYSKTHFQPELKGKAVPSTQVFKHSNIIIPRHVSSLKKSL